jgi:hypothetical protein
VLGRLDTTNKGKTLVQKGCSETAAHQTSVLRVNDNPHPPLPQKRTLAPQRKDRP